MTKDELILAMHGLYDSFDKVIEAVIDAREHHNAADEVLALCRFEPLAVDTMQLLTVIEDYINEVS